MITDAQVKAGMPSQGFVHDYVEWAMEETDGPNAYHLAVALSLLATAASKDLVIRHGGTKAAALWCLLVGESGAARKTTCIKLGEEILAEALPERLCPDPGGPAGLVEAMAAASTPQLIRFWEFGDFLARTGVQGSHVGALREVLTGFHDCRSFQKVVAGNTLTITEPRLSILAGTTSAFLEQHTGVADWTGGFMARWATVFAVRDRLLTTVVGAAHGQRAQVVERLQKIAEFTVGRCLGFTEEAYNRWHSWYLEVHRRYGTDRAQRWAQGAVERTPDVALKTALLFALDIGDAGSGMDWRLDMASLEQGIFFAEIHLDSVISVVNLLAGSKFGQDCRTVLDAIGNKPRTLGSVLRRCNPRMSKRDVVAVLDTLMEARQVAVLTVSGGSTFYSVASAEAEEAARAAEGDPAGYGGSDDSLNRNNVLPFSRSGPTACSSNHDSVKSAGTLMENRSESPEGTQSPGWNAAKSALAISSGVEGGGGGAGAGDLDTGAGEPPVGVSWSGWDDD